MTSDTAGRPATSGRALGWAAAACIGLSLLIMIVMSVNGPSVSVPALAHPASGPPWWHSFHFSWATVLLGLWTAAVIGTAGVIVGLVAVSRGARPPVRPLLGLVFVVIAVLTVLPPGGSTDTISYGIDGSMVVAGHSPYVMTPNEFKATGASIARHSPQTWQNSLSDYGPLATGSEWLAAELGGGSMARITFWLKLWTALSFGAVALLLDWLLRKDPHQRLRALLLWSANPLLLWEIVAGGHIDGLAVAFGLAGIGALWVRRPGDSSDHHPGLARACVAGALIGAAIAVKIPFAVYAVGAAWMLRRRLGALGAATAGGAAVLIASYAVSGRAAISVLFKRGNQVTWDNLYQVFWKPFGVNTYEPKHLVTIAGVLCLVVAAILVWKLPDRSPAWPAVTLALALSFAWIFMWPFQRPWYDVMIIAPLALYPASRLDWVVLARLGFGAITYMDAVNIPGYQQLAHLQHVEGEWITSTARLLTALALLWLCMTGGWGWRSRSVQPPVTEPELQPQP